MGYTRVEGRLDTRYSPVRRSPSAVASDRHAAPRLACVKPVASVHPEPGSNSPLYNIFISFYRAFFSVSEWYPFLRYKGKLLFPALCRGRFVSLPDSLSSLPIWNQWKKTALYYSLSFLSMFQRTLSFCSWLSSLAWLVLKSECKSKDFLTNYQIFLRKN